MKITITLKQVGKKPKVVVTNLTGVAFPISSLKMLWDSMHDINAVLLPDVRLSIDVEE